MIAGRPTWFVALFVLSALALSAGAAVSLGPKIEPGTNEAARRAMQFYDAQQSNERKLEVGRKRYEQRQAARATAIKAMATELEVRQQTVVIQPKPAESADQSQQEQVSGPGLLWVLLAFAVAFLGLRYFQNRQLALAGDAFPKPFASRRK
jgi:hypothetical protein